MKHKSEAVVAIGIALVLFSLTLMLGPALESHAGSCPPGCTARRDCVVVPGGGMECTTTCECPDEVEPPDEGEPEPWDPNPDPDPDPDPDPAPGTTQTVCWAANCPPGESRLTHFSYSPTGELRNVEYREGCCGPSCPCEEPDAPPDEPITVPGDWIQGSLWGAQVQLQLPVWTADRVPYPRGMVNVPNRIWSENIPPASAWSNRVDPPMYDCSCRATGTCEDDPPAEGTICDFQIGLRTEPGNQAPEWACEESGGGYGYQAICTWPYSSAGKDYIGKGLSCEDLPAFRVTASLPYWWWFGRQWYEWKEVDQEYECVHVPGWGTAACDLSGDGNNDEDTRWIGHPVYDWVREGPNWELLDLRDYGLSTPYMLNRKVRLVNTRDCGPHPVGVLPIPVIEVQGVISNPKD